MDFDETQNIAYNYVAGTTTTTHANPCGAATTYSVGGLDEHVTCQTFWYLRRPLSFFVLGIALCRHRRPRPILI